VKIPEAAELKLEAMSIELISAHHSSKFGKAVLPCPTREVLATQRGSYFLGQLGGFAKVDSQGFIMPHPDSFLRLDAVLELVKVNALVLERSPQQSPLSLLG